MKRYRCRMLDNKYIYEVIFLVCFFHFSSFCFSANGTQVIIFDDKVEADVSLQGDVRWSNERRFSGLKSLFVSGDSINNSFCLEFLKPLDIGERDKIICHVYLPAHNSPKGIMIKFETDNGVISGLYWEGMHEVFNVSEGQAIYYMQRLPQIASWSALEFNADRAEINSSRIKKIEFITFGGDAYWDKLAVERAVE
ncbi:MAG: hypothetical protein ABH952_06525 [Candidatus Omnitrophota bacterium]